jgi:hypothetical protein
MLLDSRLAAVVADGEPLALEFVRTLSLCHSVVPTKYVVHNTATAGFAKWHVRGKNGEVEYKASSPDEEALILGVGVLGAQLVHSDSREISKHSFVPPLAATFFAIISCCSKKKGGLYSLIQV